MLQPCSQNPKLSAYESMKGAFHFDATPMAPPGKKVYVHGKLEGRVSWGLNSPNAWYIGLVKKHYRYLIVAMESTAADRMSEKMWFDHNAELTPDFALAYRTVAATKHLTDTIWQQPPTAPPEELSEVHRLRKEIFGEQPPIQTKTLRPTMEVVPTIMETPQTPNKA